MRKKNEKRWKKMQFPGLWSDKEGNILVRAAVKTNGKTTEKKRVLPPGTKPIEALQVHEELRQLLGGVIESPPPTRSLLDFAEVWIEAYARRTRPRVAEVASATLRDHVLPEIGHVAIDKLTRQHIIDMTAHWTEKMTPRGEPYAKATLQTWLRVTRAFVADACAEHQIAFVPTFRVTLPRIRRAKRREQRTLTPQQVLAMLEAVERYQPRRYAEVAMLALGGFRPSEIYALLWSDVNLERGEVVISKSVDHGHLDGTKTERSDRDDVVATRVQVVPKRAVDALRSHRKWLMETHHTGLSSGLVFPSDRGGYRTPAGLTKLWPFVESCTRLGQHVSPQVLRRTYNTIMKGLTDMATLHAMIGHADEEMTELYSHISYEAKAQAVASLEALLARASGA